MCCPELLLGDGQIIQAECVIGLIVQSGCLCILQDGNRASCWQMMSILRLMTIMQHRCCTELP